MISRTVLVKSAKLLAHDVATGDIGAASAAAAHVLAHSLQSAPALLDLMLAEAGRKRPDEELIAAYIAMLGQALEMLRYADERGDPAAQVVLAAVRAKLLGSAKSGQMDAALLLLVAQQFAVAKLDIGDELRSTMAAMIPASAVDLDLASSDGTADYLSDLVRDFGGDVFAIYDALSKPALALPEDHRVAMAGMLLGCPDSAVRQAALGWLLDPSPVVREQVALLLAGALGDDPAARSTVRRMIALRNWVPEAERTAVDAAVRACRRQGIEPLPPPAARPLAVVASGFDGAGAQSLFIIVKEGRKHALASVLLKHGIGVRDAWTQHGLKRAEVASFLREVSFGVDVYKSSMDYLRAALPHFLAVNHASGVLPPFGLLDIVETIGMSPLNPSLLSVAEMNARLLDQVPVERIGSARTEAALAASGKWPDDYPFMDTWFEDDAALDSLLGPKRLSKAKRAAVVLERLLPQRRRRWAELLAWSAWTTRGEEADGAWVDLALVSRELLGDRPLAEIPLMQGVAEATVEARLGNRAC